MLFWEVEGAGLIVCCKSDIKSCRLRSSTFRSEGETASDERVDSSTMETQVDLSTHERDWATKVAFGGSGEEEGNGARLCTS